MIARFNSFSAMCLWVNVWSCDRISFHQERIGFHHGFLTSCWLTDGSSLNQIRTWLVQCNVKRRNQRKASDAESVDLIVIKVVLAESYVTDNKGSKSCWQSRVTWRTIRDQSPAGREPCSWRTTMDQSRAGRSVSRDVQQGIKFLLGESRVLWRTIRDQSPAGREPCHVTYKGSVVLAENRVTWRTTRDQSHAGRAVSRDVQQGIKVLLGESCVSWRTTMDQSRAGRELCTTRDRKHWGITSLPIKNIELSLEIGA
jgi:hypothetical protein